MCGWHNDFGASVEFEEYVDDIRPIVDVENGHSDDRRAGHPSRKRFPVDV